MPRAFTKPEQDLIRARLLKAGKSLINLMGIRRLILDDIVRDAGISKGSFYSFFPSREDFILSVFESWEEEYRGLLLKEVSEGKGNVRERIERFILGAFAIFKREPGLAQIRSKEIELLIARLPPERLAAHQKNDRRVLESAFSRWSEEGHLADDAKEALPGLLPSLFAIALHRDDFPPDAFDPTVKFIAQALAARLAAR